MNYNTGMFKTSVLGEGGTFALYQGLFPPADDDYENDRTLTIVYDEHKVRLDEKLRPSSGKRQISQVFHLPILIWVRFSVLLVDFVKRRISVFLVLRK